MVTHPKKNTSEKTKEETKGRANSTNSLGNLEVSAGNTGTAPAKATKSVVLGSLKDLGNIPPVGNSQLTTHYVGYVLTHRHHDKTKALIFTKVLHFDSQENKWKTILFYQPTIELPFGTEIQYELTTFVNKAGNPEPSVINVVEIRRDTPLAQLNQWLRQDTVVESQTIESISITDLAIAYMSKNHVGEGSKLFKNFLDTLGVFSVVGSIGENIIVKK